YRLLVIGYESLRPSSFVKKAAVLAQPGLDLRHGRGGPAELQVVQPAHDSGPRAVGDAGGVGATGDKNHSIARPGVLVVDGRDVVGVAAEQVGRETARHAGAADRADQRALADRVVDSRAVGVESLAAVVGGVPVLLV